MPPVACLLILPCCAQALPAQQAESSAPITLEQAMADPAWIARSPERAAWTQDGSAITFQRDDEQGISRRWIHELASGESHEMTAEEQVLLAPRGGDWNEARTIRVLSIHGDLFLDEPGGRGLVQLTRTSASEGAAKFLLDEQRIVFRRDSTLLIRDLTTGLEYEPARLLSSDPPEEDGDEEKEEKEGDFLEEQQQRLFPHFARRDEIRDAERARDKELRDARKALIETDMPEPFYLGKGNRVVGSDLSPDGRWMLVRLQKESRGDDSKRDQMPRFVTEDSWVSVSSVRGNVGSREARTTSVVLLDLQEHVQHAIDLATLPGILEDPLAFLTEDAETTLEEPRAISIWRASWSPDASTVVFAASSADYKDRWTVAIDVATAEMQVIERLHDPAWVLSRNSSLGWREDGSALWYTSEASGWSQLYAWNPVDGSTTRMTQGDWEVSSVRTTKDGSALLFRGNREHPGVHELYRMGFDGAPAEQITHLQGRTSGTLSPDGTQLLLTHSNIFEPNELYVQALAADAEAKRITHTVEAAFAERNWVMPEVVAIPGRGGTPIYARIYLPEEPASGLRPAVCFIHGAGYLQNAHYGWSSYQREFLFHQLLVSRGYVVIDADFRASAGYGSAWRTAIYRDMGRPETEDYQDCIAWAAEHHQVDPTRVGAYGGSYGGFVTLMAMFREPQLFAAGAALRPVTDWAHYHHGYTAPILNTPEVDPEAYRRSSPIEFAEGLENPLLICHGMVDDNVLAKDSIRLAQRLIELGKENWDLALFPIEPHSFREAASWTDEYRRILELFEAELRGVR